MLAANQLIILHESKLLSADPQIEIVPSRAVQFFAVGLFQTIIGFG
jgi:hypothetical protein